MLTDVDTGMVLSPTRTLAQNNIPNYLVDGTAKIFPAAEDQVMKFMISSPDPDKQTRIWSQFSGSRRINSWFLAITSPTAGEIIHADRQMALVVSLHKRPAWICRVGHPSSAIRIFGSSSEENVWGWPQMYSTWVQTPTGLCQYSVTSFTSPHYLWRSLGPFSLPCAQEWP